MSTYKWFQLTVMVAMLLSVNSFQLRHMPTRTISGFRMEVKKSVSDLHEVDLSGKRYF